jgi:H+/Cl- antiporter ClcA
MDGLTYRRKIVNWVDRLTEDYANTQAVGLWIAAIFTGCAAVSYARIFKIIERYTDQYEMTNPQYLFFVSPVLMLLAWWIVYKFAPGASGSGIPQVMAAIDTDYSGTNVKFVDRLLSLKTIVVKVASSLLCVAAGGAIGREGPTLQISASIFHLVGKGVRKYFPNSDEQTWVIAGAAAGLASAFNTPLGGIVYAIEELGMHHFHRVRTALLSAVIISGLVAQAVIGSYLYLGYPQVDEVTMQQWSIILLSGIVSGLAGGIFNRMLYFLSSKRRAICNQRMLGFIAIFCGFFIALLVLFQPEAQGSGTELISNILFKDHVATTGITLSRFFGTAIAYLSGAAGGIFSPSLSIGASIGSLMASLFHIGNSNLFVLLGMIGFLTGVTHTPFTSFILVMEMSNHHSAIFPMMFTALIANSVAKSVKSKSFYESVKEDLLRNGTEPSPAR